MAILVKLFQPILTYLILPLVQKYILELVEYLKRRKEQNEHDEELDKAIEKIVKADTAEEQKNALKELVQGVRRRRANK